MAEVTAEKVIAAYRKIRDQLDTERQKYQAAEKELKAKLDKLEVWLLNQMNAIGTSQFKGTAGVAYKQEDVKASTGDWEATWKFIGETGRFDMLEKRLSNKTIKDYFAETGNLPPGVNIHREWKVVVRKS